MLRSGEVLKLHPTVTEMDIESMNAQIGVEIERLRAGVTKWDRRFLELAKLVSTWSKDPSTQTGAALVYGKQLLATGFNGFPQSMPDSPELYANREEKYSRIVHCEMNALLFAGHIPQGTTLYTFPFLSCERCAVHMLQAGVTRFVAPKPTEDQLTRWGAAFEKTKRYITECQATWVEVESR